MRFPVTRSLLFLAGSLVFLRPVWGDVGELLGSVVLTGELGEAVPLSQPLRSRFGLGIMPSLSAALPMGSKLLTGLRLRTGILMNGPAPKDPSIRDPGLGGVTALFAIARVRPLGGATPDDHLTGLYVELGLGAGRTGSLIRGATEVGLGWGFSLGRVTLGPTLRYLHILEKNIPLKGNDAKLLLLGVELALGKAGATDPKTVSKVGKEPSDKQDTDGDKIFDVTDKCPTEMEDMDGFEDEDGCPDPDNDKDGIADAVDKCPNQPETINNIDDSDGCPEAAVTEAKEERLSYEEHVLFDSNSARIRPEGQPILWALVNLWKQHPEWDRLVIEGHADQRGSEDYNNWLSQARAEHTRAVLIAMGFPADKVEVAGYGNRLPRKPGNDENAFRENRRVELIIVRKKANPP